MQGPVHVTKSYAGLIEAQMAPTFKTKATAKPNLPSKWTELPVGLGIKCSDWRKLQAIISAPKMSYLMGHNYSHSEQYQSGKDRIKHYLTKLCLVSGNET